MPNNHTQAAQERTDTNDASSHTGPVYLTEMYNCYDAAWSGVCLFFADSVVKSGKARKLDMDWLVDAFRDQLARILKQYNPNGSASMMTYAFERLKSRKNNVIRKYQSMCRHNAEIIPEMQAHRFTKRVDVDNMENLTDNECLTDSDPGLRDAQRLFCERIQAVVRGIPNADYRRICELLEEERFVKTAANRFGVTDKCLVHTWIPKIKAYFERIGLTRNAVKEHDYEF